MSWPPAPGDARACGVGNAPPGGALLDTTEIIGDVVSVAVTCADRNGRTADECGQVLMTIELTGPGGPFKVAAARRIDGDLSTSFGPAGNRSPSAVITSSLISGYRPLAVSFDGSTSSDPEGSALSYSWDFADGSTSTSVSPTHSYDHLGSFTVTLTVSDSGGATSTSYVVVTVGNRLPSVVVAADQSGVTPGTVVAFSSAGTSDPDPGGSITSYSWNFGDGSPSVTGPNPTHLYSVSGTYSAQLTALDNDGGSTSATVTISVSDLVADATTVPDPAPTSTVTP